MEGLTEVSVPIYEENGKGIYNLSIKDLSFGGIIPMINAVMRIGDAEENPLNFWYIGIDLLNVHRADFNYNDENNATVILYSPTAYDIFGSKAYILVMFVIFAIVFCTILGAVVRRLCSKKRQSEIKKGEELLEL